MRKGGATAAYRPGIHHLDVKWHGMWASNAFPEYIAAPFMAVSPVTATLARPTASDCVMDVTNFTLTIVSDPDFGFTGVIMSFVLIVTVSVSHNYGRLY